MITDAVNVRVDSSTDGGGDVGVMFQAKQVVIKSKVDGMGKRCSGADVYRGWVLR